MYTASNIFTKPEGNAKLAKGIVSRYYNVGLFLAPWKTNSLGVNLCPFASEHCIADCIYETGLAAVYASVNEARKRKTEQFLADRQAFYSLLILAIEKAQKTAKRLGKKLVVRLNGTSDIDWPLFIFQQFPKVQFYDYTKSPYRMQKFLSGQLPKNYHVTFSFSGDNETEAKKFLDLGGNVAVVFQSPNFPKNFWGKRVINGDKNDLRFRDPKNVIVALKAKGKAKKKQNAFIIPLASIGKA